MILPYWYGKSLQFVDSFLTAGTTGADIPSRWQGERRHQSRVSGIEPLVFIVFIIRVSLGKAVWITISSPYGKDSNFFSVAEVSCVIAMVKGLENIQILHFGGPQ
jgi:hypothetical protein